MNNGNLCKSHNFGSYLCIQYMHIYYRKSKNRCIYLVLGDIRKIKMVRYYRKIPRYDGLVIVTNFSNILHIYSYFVPQCINIHIKCSVVRLEVSQRPNLPEVTIQNDHASKLSVSDSIYDFLDSSKPQKNVINTKSV